MSGARTFQTLRIHGREHIQLDTVDAVPCGPDEVRLEIAHCGICGSDVHEYLSYPIFVPPAGTKHKITGVELPVPLGHEMSGVVAEIGSSVQNVQVGQAVCVNPSLDDRHHGYEACSACRLGKHNVCKRWACYGNSAPAGGFSDEVVIKARSCIPLPEGVSLKLGALAEPLAVAWHCIRVSGFEAGQNALVLGAGPIGLAITLLLTARKANKILVSEVTEQRSAYARKFGADTVINPLGKACDGDPVVSAAQDLSEDGFDVAFDCTGLQSTLDTGLKALRYGGTFLNVAIHEKPLTLNLNDIALGEKRLLGGICYTDEDFKDVLEVMASGDLPFEEMITSVVPLTDVVKGGFMELMENKAAHVKILIQPTPSRPKLVS